MVRKGYPRLASVLQGEITLDGRTIPYAVRRSSRARHVRLEVGMETILTVVIPRAYPVKRLPGLLKNKKRWILDNLARRSEVSPPFSAQQIRSGDVVSYLGRQLKVVARGNSGSERVRLDHNRLVVNLTSDSEDLSTVLERWYRAQAAELIQEKTEKWCTKLGVNHNKVTIRGQKRRWASCSPRGNLSFNWKLVMAPEPIIDYVIIHELTHLKEMNHSKRFWQLVAEYCSEWREHKKWLRMHEAELATGLFGRQLLLGI
jgi:predicted metal-dependent hydrolase